jgi:MFS family permease
MFGAIIMLPLYLQVVQGESPSSAGLKLIPLMLGIVVTSILSGKAITKTGKYKKFPIAGTIIMTAGLALMTTLSVDTPYWQIAIFAVMVGMGLGVAISMLLLSFIKPWIPSDLLVYFLFVPLILGAIIGFRMIYFANERALTLGESIKACFRLY